MEYIVDNSKYSYSYQKLREDYIRFRRMNDEEFLSHLLEILHFAVFVCYLKEIPTNAALCDKGVIHQLVHLLNEDTKEDALYELSSIRDTFNTICELA